MQLQEAQQHQRQNGQVSKATDKALALLLPDKGPRPMEIPTVYTCQDGHENRHQDPRTSARLRLRSVEPTRLSNVFMLKIMPKRLNNGSAKVTIVRGVR